MVHLKLTAQWLNAPPNSFWRCGHTPCVFLAESPDDKRTTPPVAGDPIDPAMDQGKASFTTEEMDTLRTRLSRRGQAETELPLILLDALLPRQRLHLAIPATDRMHRAMVTAALDTSRTFAMLGIEPGTGQPLRCAVLPTAPFTRVAGLQFKPLNTEPRDSPNEPQAIAQQAAFHQQSIGAPRSNPRLGSSPFLASWRWEGEGSLTEVEVTLRAPHTAPPAWHSCMFLGWAGLVEGSLQKTGTPPIALGIDVEIRVCISNGVSDHCEEAARLAAFA